MIDNWLFQNLFANLIWIIISWVVINIHKSIKNSQKENNNKIHTTYSKKILRLQFYICSILVIGCFSILAFTNVNDFFRGMLFYSIFWSSLLVLSAFECSLDNFPNKLSSNEIDNKEN